MRSIAPSMRHDRVDEANNSFLLSTKTILAFILFFSVASCTGSFGERTRDLKKKMLFLYSIEVKEKKHCTVSFSFAVVYKTISPSKGRHKKYCSYRRSQRPLRLTRKQVSRTIFFSYLITPVSFHITAFSECERNTKATIAFASDVISLWKARPFLFSCLALFCFYSFGASFFEECRASFAGVFPEADRKQFKVRSAGVVFFFFFF